MKKIPNRKKRKKLALELKRFYRLKNIPNARNGNIEIFCKEMLNSIANYLEENIPNSANYIEIKK